MVSKNITDDEIWESIVSYDTERMVLDKVKKLPDDIIKKIFQYVKSPFHIEIKNEIQKRITKSIELREYIWRATAAEMSDRISNINWRAWGWGWREYYERNGYCDVLINKLYVNKFYGFEAWFYGGYGTVSWSFRHNAPIKEIRKLGHENGVKGRSKKEIIQRLMKL